MFTYVLQRGVEIGLLKEAEYAPVAAHGYQCIVDNATIDANGLIDVHSACDCLCVPAELRRQCPRRCTWPIDPEELEIRGRHRWLRNFY
jgi:rhamnogalacturonyl hydrolase YesR